MGNGRLWRTLACLALALSVSAAARAPGAEAPARKTEVWALLLGGSQGEPVYGRAMSDWLNRAHALLTKEWKVDPSHVLLLAEKHEKVNLPPAEAPTLENVRNAFKKLKDAMKSGDRLIVLMVGHGQTNEPVGKFCLPGPDLDAEELAKMLDALATTNVVLLHFAGGGAEFQQKLGRKGRVIVCASGKLGEGNQVYFAEFFLRAYETKAADENKDGKITLLEAFNWAGHETVNWYHRQYRNRDGTWRVLGKETRALWKKLYEGSDKKLATPDNEDDPDIEPVWGKEPTDDWLSRRILAEHASLDDRGEQAGSIVWIGNEHKPLSGTDVDQQGMVARRLLLDQPELLPQ
jgi:hypothetical protein